MEDKLLPMQQVPPSPCDWCNPRERQEPIELGTSAVTGVARTMLKSVTNCLSVMDHTV